jgi:hypothetical protein
MTVPVCIDRKGTSMVGPTSHAIIDHLDLTSILKIFAAQYTSHSPVANRIALRTASIAATTPDLCDEPDIKKALLCVMHVVALEELKAAS